MNIGSGQGYPANALSNFSPHPFVLDGIQIASMEGFLQSLKFESADMAKYVCTLVGKAAKFKGKNKNWRVRQTLYWLGQPIKRESKEYQDLLDRAYRAMFEQSESFRNALKASGNSTLTHSIGRNDYKETVLTVNEFCRRLNSLRNEL